MRSGLWHILFFMVCTGSIRANVLPSGYTHLATKESVSRQQNVVSGTIKDRQGTPLIGVSVTIRGTSIQTKSTTEGKFSISAPSSESILVFSYMGFSTLEQRVGNNKNFDMVMQETATDLDEVVVVGYGQQKRSELTGAISSIRAEDMDEYAGGSLNTSMQGKISGLNITTNSGEPGAGAAITLRGVSSINGSSSPLIIIDGVPMNNDEFASLEDGAAFSPLNDINPADIESIELLKDAASASIYGARASNGVLLITTKSGEGKPAEINASVNSSVVSLARKLGVLNGPQFRSAYQDAIFNATGSPTTKVSVIDSLHPWYRESYNYQDIMYRNALQHKADISARGSSKDRAVGYYVSAGYRDQEPIIIHTKYRQYTGAAKVNYKISSKLAGVTNFNLSNYEYNRLNTGNNDRSVIRRYLISFPIYSPWDPYTGEVIPLIDNGKINPVAQAMYTKNEVERWRFLGKQEFSYELFKNLEFRTNVSMDYSATTTNYFQPPILNSSGSGKSVYSIYNPLVRKTFINENFFTWKKKIQKYHNINFLLGQSNQYNLSNEINIRGINSLDNEMSGIGGTAQVTNKTQREEEYVLRSFFTRLNYNYKSKYLLSMLMRADGSSRFGPNNRWGYFPSISTGWLFSEEDFVKKMGVLYSGKLRVSYGITGNQEIGNYATRSLYEFNASTYDENISIISRTVANPNLKWETTKQFNTGVDLAFLRGRLNVTADYYIKNSYDLLFNVQIPSQAGYARMPYNFGSISNKGFDMQVEGILINKKTFKWTTNFTLGLNRNKVTSLPDNEDYFATTYSLARVGQPVGIFYGFKALGVYARDEDNVYTMNGDGTVVPYRKGSATGEIYKGGDVIFEDLNRDGIINDEDLQVIGDPTPDFFGGFQNKFTYKQFTLTAFINYTIGGNLLNQLKRGIDGNQFDVNFTTDQLRRWRNQGDVTDVPILVKADPMENYAVSTRFVEDGSFIRLQNLALNYQFSKNQLSKVKLKGLNIGISAQNLLTFASYTGYDPEISSGSNPFGFGVDNGAFPRSRFYSLSLNIKL
ncbi:TonB-dependent receptor [Parapedobacter sp. SGR-10]|uniref:SusC/RagA family TonB-linked outer membrane protein n=1 Tax=Parapedobacter sp. SGR-10 TaxID=2710879 RepID=UPI0013D7659B|nr:TonB-dependent receptor [Parapedobacter sp. SGR-10]NGF55829.1 TonB-dependent receptor [Parapedobacter sp. SGR-10]